MLSIKAKNRDRALRQDQSIDIELSNPMFNNTEMFSYPVELPFDGNRDLVKNVEDSNADLRPIALEHTPMQIIANGIPFASGPMVISEDEELVDSISVNIDAAVENFDSMISGLECTDIPIPSEDYQSLIIGEKISEVNVQVQYWFEAYLHSKKGKDKELKIHEQFPWQDASSTFDPQALGFSYPAKCDVESPSTQVAVNDGSISYEDGIVVNKPRFSAANCYTNVTDEYLGNKRGSALGGAKFCNARVAYKHYDINEDGTTSDKVVEADEAREKNMSPENHGKLWVLDAHRPKSGICFYVLYFLECLFKYLGVSYDIEALKAIEDMRHLCFFTTKCSYRLSAQPIHGTSSAPFFSAEVGRRNTKTAVSDADRKSLFDGVNLWLSSRGCGGKLELEKLEGVQVQEMTVSVPDIIDGVPQYSQKTFVIGDNIDEIKITPTLTWARATANIYNMIADEGNFPKMPVSSLLSSLENMFGIKFSYDYEQKKVTAYLLRDVLRHDIEPRMFHANIFSMNKVTEKITGVRIGYSKESDAKEQRDNIKNK